ncbi:hypothetical protein ACOJ08_08480 [Ornithinimicrobium sp. Y1847]|uniref:hypothetical protein n=2 Tax=Ornithinimicrobium sp. Y1847 TaxID=3405419 RepID=UPI003B66C0E5
MHTRIRTSGGKRSRVKGGRALIHRGPAGLQRDRQGGGMTTEPSDEPRSEEPSSEEPINVSCTSLTIGKSTMSRGGAKTGQARSAFPILENQRGLATSAQLKAVGWTGDAIRHARSRRIRQVLPGVFMHHLGPLDFDDRLVAAALWAGRFAVLTGSLALHHHGVKVDLGVGTFLVPSSCRARSAAGEFSVRTVRSAREIVVQSHRGCVAITDPARALCDAAAYDELRGSDLRAATIAVLQKGLTTPERLRAEVEQRRSPHLGEIHAGLESFDDGAWSLPEVELGTLVDACRDLPRYLMNVRLSVLDRESDQEIRIGTPDGYFPDAGVVVQVHSRTYHSGVDDQGHDLWSKTVEADATYLEHDVPLVAVTPTSIRKRPEKILDRLKAVVHHHLGRDVSRLIIRDAEGQLIDMEESGSGGQSGSVDHPASNEQRAAGE